MLRKALCFLAISCLNFLLMPLAAAERNASDGSAITIQTNASSVRLGVVYSSWGGNRYEHEFDDIAARLNWKVDHLENIAVGEWISRLSQFQIVIATTALVENAPDMARHREEWNRWISGGGILVVVDANYTQVLEKWLCALGGAEVALSAMAVKATDVPANPEKLQCDTSSGILTSPNDVRSYLRGKSEGTWSRLVSWGNDWQNIVGISPSESYLMMREQGKGLVVAMCYSAFEGEKDKPHGYRLFENIFAGATFRNAGLTLKEFSIGPATVGNHVVRCALQGTDAARPQDYSATLAVFQGDSLVQIGNPTAGHLEGTNLIFNLPYRVDQRGKLTLKCTLSQKAAQIVTLSRIQEIPRTVIELQPYNRHPHPAHPLLSFGCQLTPDYGVSLTNCSLRIAIDGTVVQNQPTPASANDYCITTPALKSGPHTLAVALLHQGHLIAETNYAFTQTDVPAVYYRPDGVFMVKGAPFFPLGWYHVSWATPAADRTKAMRTIGAAGFNFISASMRNDDFPGNWRAFLADAQSNGVMVLTETRVAWSNCLPVLKNRPAAFGVTAVDEPDGHGYCPSHVNALNDAIKLQDANLLTWCTLCSEESLEKYVGLTDIAAPDPYPYLITHDEHSRDRLNVFRIVKKTADLAKARGTTCMAVIQCFGGYEIFNVPSFAQVRSMTFQALLAGAKGIVFYTFNDSDLEANIHRFRMEEHPDLWRDLQTLPLEIQALSPALFNGKQFIADTSGQRDVYAGGWIMPGKILVCVINDSNTEAQEVAIRLPANAGPNLRPLFQGRPCSLKLQDGKIMGVIGPMETQVYEISQRN